MGSISHHLPAETTQDDLEALIKKLNADKGVHGILVQLPLPSHLNEERVLQLISIEKDVDGFSPINIGRLAQKAANRFLCLARRMAASISSRRQESRSRARMPWCSAAPTLWACRRPCC